MFDDWTKRQRRKEARVIAATNRNLPEAVANGKFREDLYYRLNVLECNLVPLRHRTVDLPILIKQISAELSRGKTTPRPLSETVMNALLSYNWPGNIRELRNVIERLLMLCQGRDAKLEDLPEGVLKPARSIDGAIDLLTLEEVEKRHIQHILSRTESLEKAAETLGITTVTLWRKRKEYGLI
jgi:transcriptional regulator with PAS, ATPase and Fis domain